MGWIRENLFFLAFFIVFIVMHLFRHGVHGGRDIYRMIIDGNSDKGSSQREGKGRMLNMLNIKIVSWSLGLFATVSFILCVLYGLVVPQRLHGMSAFLEMMLPAFKWLTFGGFILGLAESFLYGVYIGVVFVPLYNFINKRWGRKEDNSNEI